MHPSTQRLYLPLWAVTFSHHYLQTLRGREVVVVMVVVVGLASERSKSAPQFRRERLVTSVTKARVESEDMKCRSLRCQLV